MSVFDAVLLGIIQGVTEFLPVSSTAHLTIAGQWLGLIDPAHPEEWTAFIAVMQLGTTAAVVVYFFRDLLGMAGALARDLRLPRGPGRWSGESRLAWYIVLGTVPVGVVGLALKKIIEGALTKELTVIGSSLIVLALILLWAERAGKRVRGDGETTWKDALTVGCAQVFALIPGSSRSGTTITAGLFCGLKRETAARFSFLLSIPAVVASGLLELKSALHHTGTLDMAALALSTGVSAVVGYAAIAFLLRYLRTHTTYLFIWYRIALGALLWAMVITR